MGTSTNTVIFQCGEREHILGSFLALSVDKEQLFSLLYERSVLPKSKRCPNSEQIMTLNEETYFPVSSANCAER